MICRLLVPKLKTGTTLSSTKRSSRAWTTFQVPINGRQSSRGSSSVLHRRRLSTSNCYGETLSLAGFPQVLAWSRSVTAHTLSSPPRAMVPPRLLRIPLPSPRVSRSLARRTSLRLCVHMSGSGEYTLLASLSFFEPTLTVLFQVHPQRLRPEARL